MNTIEDLNDTIKTHSENQARSVELQAAYYSALAKEVGEGATVLAEDTRTHLESLVNSDSFTAVFKASVKFEDSVKAKVASFYEKNTEAAKALVESIGELYDFPTNKAAETPNKPTKTARKKAA
jgi:hypothetical protein